MMHIECCIPVSKRAPCGSKPSHIVLQVCCRVEEESRSDRSTPVSDAVLALSLHVLDHNWMAFIVLYTFVFRHLSTPLFAKSLCLRKLLFPSQLGDGGMKGWLGGCRWSLRGAALSLRSLFCQPSATDQQSASQACTDLIPLSLPFFLSFFLSSFISVFLYLALLLCQRHLLSPCLLPTPTACPATNGA